MSQPLVSVIMPVYNAEAFLQEAINSVLQQSYRNWELILINDGSVDGSKAICEAQEDSRIIYLENEQNQGVLRSRNIALRHAKGDYIAWLDSDDIALPQKFARQVNFLEANSDYVMCGTLHQDIDGQGKILRKWLFPTEDRDLRSFLLLVNCFCNSSTMVRGDLMRELKFAETFEVAEDYELWYRCAQRGKLANIPEFLTLYRVHGNNISITKKGKMFAIVKTLANRILQDAGIEFSEEDLELHNRLLSFDGVYFREGDRMEALENWILRLYVQLTIKNTYNNLLLFALLAERWQVICMQNRLYGKLIKNHVLSRHPAKYYSVLWQKATRQPIRY